jgi:hypothetical protein
MKEHNDLLQNLGERSLIDLNELLQFVKVIAEQPETLIQGHITG